MNAQLRIRAHRQFLHQSNQESDEEGSRVTVVEFLVFVNPTWLLFLGENSLRECCIEAIQAACNEREWFVYVSHHVELIDTIHYNTDEFRTILIKHID